MYRENEASITAWADATFKVPSSNLRVAIRANEEFSEFLRAISTDQPLAEQMVEAADVLIVICKLAHRKGLTLQSGIRRKPTYWTYTNPLKQAALAMAQLIVDEMGGGNGSSTFISNPITELTEALEAYCGSFQCDVWKVVDEKMTINRKRVWNVGPDGCGYHVRERAAA